MPFELLRLLRVDEERLVRPALAVAVRAADQRQAEAARADADRGGEIARDARLAGLAVAANVEELERGEVELSEKDLGGGEGGRAANVEAELRLRVTQGSEEWDSSDVLGQRPAVDDEACPTMPSPRR